MPNDLRSFRDWHAYCTQELSSNRWAPVWRGVLIPWMDAANAILIVAEHLNCHWCVRALWHHATAVRDVQVQSHTGHARISGNHAGQKAKLGVPWSYDTFFQQTSLPILQAQSDATCQGGNVWNWLQVPHCAVKVSGYWAFENETNRWADDLAFHIRTNYIYFHELWLNIRAIVAISCSHHNRMISSNAPVGTLVTLSI